MARRRQLSEEERDLWQRVAASVTPLHRRPAVSPPEASPRTAPTEPDAQSMSNGSTNAAQAGDRASSAGHSPVPQPKKSSTPPLDKRTAQRLRKGKMSVEGRIDLHGMTQAEAHRALLRFIAASRSMNRRLVLVITGKGWDATAARSEDAVGVLRRSVPRWLETPPLNQHVAALVDAHVKDGGSGALYVLLRRTRRPNHKPEE